MKPKVIQISSECYGAQGQHHMLFVLREDGSVEQWERMARLSKIANEWEYCWEATVIQPEES